MPAVEQYDEIKDEFFMAFKGQVLQLEHSLVSLSKWESKWQKPFLTKDEKTMEESIDYISCMTLTKNVDLETYSFITDHNLQEVKDYIKNPMTATTFSKENQTPNREIITAELLYYWMIAMTIPFECQKWHLNRLLTLINVCNIKNKPAKKMNKREVAGRNAKINAARKQALNTKG